MGFLDKILPLSDVDKIRNPEDSESFIRGYLGEHAELLGFKNHKKMKPVNRELKQEQAPEEDHNFYLFTIKLLSLDFINKVSNDKRVKNLFYAASAPPPGGGIDSVAFRYSVYIEYY